MNNETRVGYATIDALARIQDNYMRVYHAITGEVDLDGMIKMDRMKEHLKIQKEFLSSKNPEKDFIEYLRE